MAQVRPSHSACYRFATAAVLALISGIFGGCPPLGRGPATMPARGDPGLGPVLGDEPTASGIYVPMGSYVPLTGEALKNALTDRATILANTRAFPPLTSQPAATSQPTTGEPPPMALKYYLRGREKYIDGANSEAMDFLEKALALDPDAFTVLRLMGRVCFAAGQLPRGSIYLQRAYAQHPTDVEVNYLLGRYYLERKDADRAVAHLLQADDSPERAITSAQTPLVSFYLARALQADGFNKAAAAEYERFLDTITLPVAGYRYDRELNYLIDETWAAHLSAAENYVLAGMYAKALPHYLAACEQEPKDGFIISRLVNAQVHAGQAENARKTALALVASDQGLDDSIKLLAWTYRVTGREKDLLADLRARIPASAADDPAPYLILAATEDFLGDKKAAFDTLEDYLEKHPANLDVLGRLFKRIDSGPTFQSVLISCARAIGASPEKHDDILKLFFTAADSSAGRAFLDDVHSLANSGRRSGIDCYLIALARREQNGSPRAIDSDFRLALAMNPDFFPAREAYVSFLLSREQFKAALALVQEALAKNMSGPKAWQLMVECEAAQQQLAGALKTARAAQEKFPDNPELRLQIASIYRLRGQDHEANEELAGLIDMAPKYEPAYRALVNALVARFRDDGAPQVEREKARADAHSYVARLLRAMPGSIFGRVQTAIFLANDERYAESEAILRRLSADNPDENEILALLAQVRQIQGHTEEAAATLEEPLKKHPTAELASSLAELYRAQEKPAAALALIERLMKENPDQESYVLLDASELAAQKKIPEAIVLLGDGAVKFPASEDIALALARLESSSADAAEAVTTLQTFIAKNGETASRLYTLSHLETAAGQEAAAEAALQRVLVLMPDHTGANNDLAYSWVDAGKNLAQAEPMMKKALDNEPNNSAFLDSLGWLYYKEGRFAEAIPLFVKAIALPDGMEPEVVQHLGDALYRNGQKPEAGDRWRQARNLLESEPKPLSAERQKVKRYLDAAINALERGQAPDVTPIAAAPAGNAPITGQAPTTSPDLPH